MQTPVTVCWINYFMKRTAIDLCLAFRYSYIKRGVFKIALDVLMTSGERTAILKESFSAFYQQAQNDPFRLVRYDISSASLGSADQSQPLLLRRHNAVPGLFLVSTERHDFS